MRSKAIPITFLTVKFLTILNQYKTPGVKQMADEKTINKWLELFENIEKSKINYKYISLYIKKPLDIEGVLC